MAEISRIYTLEVRTFFDSALRYNVIHVEVLKLHTYDECSNMSNITNCGEKDVLYIAMFKT